MTRDGTRMTLVCFGCHSQSLEIDDEHMPGGRTGWRTFLAEVERQGWGTVPQVGTPYPAYYCPDCLAARLPSTSVAPPSPRAQMELFA